MPKVAKLEDYRGKTPVLAKVLISQHEWINLLETLEKYINDLRPLRKNQKKLDEAMGYIKEMKFYGWYNFHFRQTTYDQVEELVDEIYAEIHS
jgi:hypothetical protein